jgi:hypothetical protein
MNDDTMAVMKKMDSYGKEWEFRKLSAVIRKSVIPYESVSSGERALHPNQSIVTIYQSFYIINFRFLYTFLPWTETLYSSLIPSLIQRSLHGERRNSRML